MINLLVVSDTHGNFGLLEKAMLNQYKLSEKHRATHLLHLGDGVDDIEHCKISERFCVCTVKGNCDGVFCNEVHPINRFFEIAGCKILMMHGHTCAVKNGLNQAVLRAVECKADILLYGHTHVKASYTVEKGTQIDNVTLENDLIVFNPGSLGYDGNFGVISIDNGNVFVSHGNVTKNSDAFTSEFKM